MSTRNIPKTPFSLFELLKMLFGLRNSGCTFQQLMDKIVQGLPYCFVDVDDVLISSPDLISHLEHVRSVLDLLRLHGLSINPDKCVYAAPKVDYLGMRVSGSGCFPLVKHTQIIFPSPLQTRKVYSVSREPVISTRGSSRVNLRPWSGTLIWPSSLQLPNLSWQMFQHLFSLIPPLNIIVIRCLLFSCWSSLVARSSRLLGSYGILLQEVIHPRNQILHLQLWVVCSLLLSPPFPFHVRR